MPDDLVLDRDQALREAIDSLTIRMENAMLSAREIARGFGHSHVGCEHVFLAILLDPESIPSQISRTDAATDDILQKLHALLSSKAYNTGVTNSSSSQ